MLDLIREGDVENLPDPSQILTYLDLFTVVALQSAPTVGRAIAAYAKPQRLIFRDGDFWNTRAALTNPNVIQMFNVVEIGNNNPPLVHGPFIQFYPDSPQYHWQLPIAAEIVLAMVISRSPNTIDDWEELQLIEQIHSKLLIRATSLTVARGRGRGGRRDGDGRRRRRRRGEADYRKSRPKEPQRKKNCRECGLNDEFDLKLLSEEVEQASDQSREQFSDLISSSCDDFD